MATQDFYALLGVPDSASPDEIKKAYRKLAKQYDPDANPNNAAAVEKFKAISEAHGVLSDPEKKAKYDQMRRLGAFGGFGSRQPSSAGQQRTRRTAGQPEEQDLVTGVVSVAELERMIRDGAVRDATTVAAFGLLRLKRLI